MPTQKHFSVENLKEGAIVDLAQNEIESIFENVMDINTEWRKARTLTIKLTFKAHDEDRENVACMAEVTAKLAPCKPIGATLQIGNERVDGKLRPVAYEVGAGNKNQLSMLTTEDVLGGEHA